jgi:hypothetical protein
MVRDHVDADGEGRTGEPREVATTVIASLIILVVFLAVALVS